MLLGASQGRASLAAVSVLVGGTAFGFLPVGKFFTLPAALKPKKPIDPPKLIVTGANGSRGQIRAGHLSLEAVLGQSKLLANGDGSLYLDLRVMADLLDQKKPERRPVDLALVLDVSGSMADENKIGLMREACLGLAERLKPEDRVAVVSFSDRAQLLFDMQPLTDEVARDRCGPLSASSRQSYRQAISHLVPMGCTNISGGLEEGAAILRKKVRAGAARRLVLLTDGIANRGLTTNDGLRTLVKKLSGEGYSVSTVGLGLDFNATLLSMLGDVGGGNYHYVDTAEKIAHVYATELEGLQTLVAKGVNVTLRPIGGARVDQVVEWASETNADGSVTVNLGDLESGRSTKVVVRLRAPTNKAVTAQDVLAISLKGEDVASNETLAPSPLALGVGVTTDPAEADASVALDVQKDLLNARVASELARARAAAEQGHYDEAKKAVDAIKALKVDSVTYTDAGGQTQSLKIDANITSAICSENADERSRADKIAASAARAAGK